MAPSTPDCSAGSWKDTAADLRGVCDLVAPSARFFPPGPQGPLTEPDDVMRWLRERGVAAVVLTRGPERVRWWCGAAPEPSSGEVLPPAVDPVDTLGAGDVFHGALAWALAGTHRQGLTGEVVAPAVEVASAVAARSTTVIDGSSSYFSMVGLKFSAETMMSARTPAWWRTSSASIWQARLEPRPAPQMKEMSSLLVMSGAPVSWGCEVWSRGPPRARRRGACGSDLLAEDALEFLDAGRAHEAVQAGAVVDDRHEVPERLKMGVVNAASRPCRLRPRSGWVAWSGT
ncbi:MAG: PfkB family carbohydrate kinase [Actinomyces sp.]|nr:PfkB family carbohydrate kinase [Actinomyces sp.]MDO4243080.1 PfkB family carbohydrate kinase [Actinomyces sp.]